MARTTDKESRRAALVSAAMTAVTERGVAGTSVSDIVRTAGVAQGTFYLYFDSKDEVVFALVERIAGQMAQRMEEAVSTEGATAVQKLLGFRDVLVAFDADPTALELADLLHRPENRTLHDRLDESFLPRLVPLVERIVAQGIAEGVFDVPDSRTAAFFVLGGLRSIELSGVQPKEMPAALDSVTELVLRALGCSPEQGSASPGPLAARASASARREERA